MRHANQPMQHVNQPMQHANRLILHGNHPVFLGWGRISCQAGRSRGDHPQVTQISQRKVHGKQRRVRVAATAPACAKLAMAGEGRSVAEL